MSLRCGDVILITPSGMDKGEIAAGQIRDRVPGQENLLPGLKLSIETEMHLEVTGTART